MKKGKERLPMEGAADKWLSGGTLRNTGNWSEAPAEVVETAAGEFQARVPLSGDGRQFFRLRVAR